MAWKVGTAELLVVRLVFQLGGGPVLVLAAGRAVDGDRVSRRVARFSAGRVVVVGIEEGGRVLPLERAAETRLLGPVDRRLFAVEPIGSGGRRRARVFVSVDRRFCPVL